MRLNLRVGMITSAQRTKVDRNISITAIVSLMALTTSTWAQIPVFKLWVTEVYEVNPDGSYTPKCGANCPTQDLPPGIAQVADLINIEVTVEGWDASTDSGRCNPNGEICSVSAQTCVLSHCTGVTSGVCEDDTDCFAPGICKPDVCEKSPSLGGFQWTIDSSTYSNGGPGPGLAPAELSCTTDADCLCAYTEIPGAFNDCADFAAINPGFCTCVQASCDDNVCGPRAAAYIDSSPIPNYVFFGHSSLEGIFVDSLDYEFGGLSLEGSDSGVPEELFRCNAGSRPICNVDADCPEGTCELESTSPYYLGTLLLEATDEACGLITLDLMQDFLQGVPISTFLRAGNAESLPAPIVETLTIDFGGAVPCGDGDTCPATNVGVLTNGSTIVGSTFGSADDFVAGCGSEDGGQDRIFEFSVDFPGVWGFDSCTVPACWDTTLEIREETGGGCPGEFVTCDADGCNVCYYESRLSFFLIPASTYYLIVDGWNSSAYGDFTITATLSVAGCANDSECDDGSFCNGAETCDTATGQCMRGSPPCTTFEGYTAPCDEATDSCPQPDNCLSWIAGTPSEYFFPVANHCPDLASWVFDDVQVSHHTTGVLDFYTTPIIAHSTPSGASPLGTTFSVDQALFTVATLSCNPLAEIAGSQCTGTATVDPDGSPPHDLPCSGTMPLLPNNVGDFNRCEIDFYMAYRTTENGAGFAIPLDRPQLGGPAIADEFGSTGFALENCPPTGVFKLQSLPADDVDLHQDFATAVVCLKPGGSCCKPDGSCSLTSEADCAALGGTFGFVGTINGTDGGCGGDPDGDGLDNRCGDNCPDDDNPGQEDCDGDGAGDACDPEGDADGEDGDGVCQGDDNCPLINNPDQDDADGDGAGDPCDPCPIDPNDDSDGDGVCDSADSCPGGDDRFDDDLDGVPDDCDGCPGNDDTLPGARDDDDGDGVLNCNDLCPGVDDAVFGDCTATIPTASVWGLLILALLLLASGKVVFRERLPRYRLP